MHHVSSIEYGFAMYETHAEDFEDDVSCMRKTVTDNELEITSKIWFASLRSEVAKRKCAQGRFS